MPPFHFRLEQVLRYRKQCEEQAMLALARAVEQRDRTLAKKERLQEELQTQRERLSRPEGLQPAERWLTVGYEAALKTDLARAQALLIELEKQVDQCRTALVQKAKERGLLDSLKEKQAQRHNYLERQQEQRTNDETATLRYTPISI